MTNKKILIPGLGNEILSDDGIGPHLIKNLAEKIQGTDTEFVTSSCRGLEIMEYIHGNTKVAFVDAIRTINWKPGNDYYFTPSDLKETSNLSNLHEIKFYDCSSPRQYSGTESAVGFTYYCCRNY